MNKKKKHICDNRSELSCDSTGQIIFCENKTKKKIEKYNEHDEIKFKFFI